jgi:glycosyltransferase involved in cell wall biosynthesis
VAKRHLLRPFAKWRGATIGQFNQNKMKVLWLCSWYPSTYIYHNGFFVRRQAEAVARFADVATLHAVEKTADILLPDGSKRPNIDLSSQKDEGDAYEILINRKTHFEVVVAYPKSKNALIKYIRQFTAYQKGFKALKQAWGTPDLVHLHVIVSAGIYALFLYYVHRLPFLITEHSSMYRTETGVFRRSNWLFKAFVKLCVRKAKAIIALSPFYASTMQKHGLNNRFFYVPNVVNTDLFTPQNELNNNLIDAASPVHTLTPAFRLGLKNKQYSALAMNLFAFSSEYLGLKPKSAPYSIPSLKAGVKRYKLNIPLNNSPLHADNLIKNELKTIKLIHVSGLHDPIKNVSGILKAIEKLSKKRQDFTLDIIGDPLEQPPYRALVKQLGIEKYIQFYSYLTIEEVAERMQNSDIFVLFSRFEGLPCVILEAMSVGLPVVATETGGISDWITEGSGRLVASENEAALTESLNFVMGHLADFDAQKIREKIVETCSYAAVGSAIVEIYKEMYQLKTCEVLKPIVYT